MKYLDRLDAAEQLAVSLSAYRGSHPLVMAIPRGAVPMGHVLAQRLGGDLEVLLVRKLRYPGSPELAMGAMSGSGWTYLNPDLSAAVSAQDLAKEKSYQLEVLHAREIAYFQGREPMNPHGRTVMVVDDGMATGATMLAALESVWVERPKKLICAVPVASPNAIELVKPWCDEVVCLEISHDFMAVGQFYENFEPVEDAQVLNILQNARLQG